MRHRSFKSQAVRTLEYGPPNQPITAHLVMYFERVITISFVSLPNIMRFPIVFLFFDSYIL